MTSLDVTLEFSGGAELLFDKVKTHQVGVSTNNFLARFAKVV